MMMALIQPMDHSQVTSPSPLMLTPPDTLCTNLSDVVTRQSHIPPSTPTLTLCIASLMHARVDEGIDPERVAGDLITDEHFITFENHWTEVVTGLGAAGVEIILAHVGEHPMQGHPLVPLLQASAAADVRAHYGDELDLALSGSVDGWAGELLDLLAATASRRYRPLTVAQDNTDFQFTRGLLGVSM